MRTIQVTNNVEKGASSLDGTNHVPALDGFRGVAILLVLLFHNFGMPFGWLGVDIFFVLSGFLITRILLVTRERQNYFRNFYTRRAARIFPVYYLLLGLLFVLDPAERGHLWWYACYLSDFTFLRPEREIQYLHHTWSLSVEEQFYLIWPLIVKLFRSQRLIAICVATLAAAVISRLLALPSGISIEFVNFNILPRCDGLITGALMALMVHRGARPSEFNIGVAKTAVTASLGILAILMVTRRLSVSVHPNVWMQTLGMWSIVFGAAAAIWLGIAERFPVPLQRLLLSRPLLYTGRISYGLYLWHHPILIVAKRHFPSPEGLLQVLLFGTAITGASYLVAAMSWHCFESPINALKGRLAPAKARAGMGS